MKHIFTDVTIEAGLLSFHPTQAADWADYDGDGWDDIFVTDFTIDPKDPTATPLIRNAAPIT